MIAGAAEALAVRVAREVFDMITTSDITQQLSGAPYDIAELARLCGTNRQPLSNHKRRPYGLSTAE